MIRREFPRTMRVAVAPSKADQRDGQMARGVLHFRVGRVQVDNQRREMVYPTDPELTRQLAAAVGYTGDLKDFRPENVPVVLMGDDPVRHGWFKAHLSCWPAKCTSAHLYATGRDGSPVFRPKSAELLAEPEQREALFAQAIRPVHVDERTGAISEGDVEDGFGEEDVEGRAELWIGRATRTVEGKRRIIACDPLLCPYFRNPDERKRCKPKVTVMFVAPWATGEVIGFFESGAWSTLARLVASISIMQNLLASQGLALGGARALLQVRPKVVGYDGGKSSKQPCVGLSLAVSPDELISQLERLNRVRAQLPQHVPAPLLDMLALPEAKRAWRQEFTPEAFDERLSVEETLRTKWRERFTEAVINSVLERTDDPDEADAILESMWQESQSATKDATPITPEPVKPEPAPAAPHTGGPSQAAKLLAQFTDIAESHSWTPAVCQALKASAKVGKGEVTVEAAERLVALATAKVRQDGGR